MPARVKRLERAIERGLIRWHGLPFTTHSELMSPALFRAGLSFSKELDRRFGKQTIAAKMTDVPGHTIGIVPLLAEAGLQLPAPGRQHRLAGARTCPTSSAGARRTAPRSSSCTRSPTARRTSRTASTRASASPTPTTTSARKACRRRPRRYRHLQAANEGATLQASTLEDYGRLLWAAPRRVPGVRARDRRQLDPRRRHRSREDRPLPRPAAALRPLRGER